MIVSGGQRALRSAADIDAASPDIAAAMLEAVPGMVALLSPEAEIESVNRELLAYIGQPLETIKQWGTNGIVLPEDVPGAAAILRQAMSTGQPYETEIRVRRSDGVYRWNSTRGIPFRDSSGAIVRWYAVISDIDDRKRAEEALRESQQRYERVMVASEAGLFDWDLVNDKYYLSPQMLAMSGIAPGTTFRGRTDFIYQSPIFPEDRERYLQQVRELFAGTESRLTTELRLLVNGETRWMSMMGMCFRDEGGKAVRWTGSATDITERKRAEALLDGEKRLLEMMAQATPLAAILDKLCRIVEENMSGCLCGISLVDATDTRPLNAAGPNLPPAYARAVDDGLRTIWTTPILSSTKRTLGTFAIYFAQPASPTDEHLAIIERFTHVAAVAIERSHNDQARRLSEERYALAMDAAADGHMDWDLVSGAHYVSARMLAMIGHPADATFADRADWVRRFPFHPDDRRRWEGDIAAHFAGREARFRNEYRVVVNGETRWLAFNFIAGRDPSGEPVRWTGSITDVTDRKTAQEALRQSEERYALASDGASQGIFDWDLRNDCVFHSRQAQEFFGLQVGETYRARSEWAAMIRYDPEDLPRMRKGIGRHLRGETPMCDIEYRVMPREGEVRWLRQRGALLRDESGKPYRMAGSIEDITERKVAGQALRNMEQELRRAQRLEAMGTLAGGIAHDFNNILGAILGYGEMAMRDAGAGSRLARDLEAIMAAGERGRALVDRILAFSRSGVGERVAVHVEAVVREALDQLAAKLPANVTIAPRLHAARAAMLGDSTQVHQVVMNLANNAVQAMPHGGTVRISLEVARVEAPRTAAVGALSAGEYVVLRVADSGTGIPPDVLDRMFDPFFTTKEVGVGTGLGLSLVHGIVTSVGGAIDVATRLGEGTTFTVYLRRSGEATEQAADAERPLPRGAGQFVLVVDDEAPLVRLATETLERLGYAPVGFTSSVNALREFGEDPGRFDAILTDERMPGITGLTMIQEVRRIDPSIPIVLMSGFVGAEAAQKARELGASDVLKKPLLARDLAASLARALQL